MNSKSRYSSGVISSSGLNDSNSEDRSRKKSISDVSNQQYFEQLEETERISPEQLNMMDIKKGREKIKQRIFIPMSQQTNNQQ